jgi:drug/metabolite transporter (DMT)-like permease
MTVRQRSSLGPPMTARWGVALALTTALISGVAVFVNGYGVKQVPDAAVYTTIKNGVAALFLLAFAGFVVPGRAVRQLTRRDWLGLAVIGVVGGSVPFILFFSGLAVASAPTAAFIHKTLFIWVALLAVPFLGERLGILPIGAMAVLLAGQAMATPPTGIVWGAGETMIAAATLLWSVEVILARRLLLGRVPSPVLGAARLGIGLVVLIAYVAVSGRLGILAGLTPNQWFWALVTGLPLAGYVATWLAALKRAPASVVTSVLVLGAPITAALQAIANGAVPAPGTVLGQLLIVVAALGLAALAARRPVAVGAPA